MKLLLTSGGITNDSIALSLENLSGKVRSETKIGFIPTAANVELGNKDWFIKQLTDLMKFGYSYIDLVDVSASDLDWRSRLADVDVVCVGGGNTFHLLNQIRNTGLDIWLQENLKNKVYLGISAGSIVATPTIASAGIEPGDINYPEITDLTGLNYVNFEISPHSPDLTTLESNEEYAKTTAHQLYAIDDQSAIEINEDKITVISEGTWKILNN